MTVLAAVHREDASYEAVLRAASRLAGLDSFEVLSVYPSPTTDVEEVAYQSPDEQTAEARESLRAKLAEDVSRLSLNAKVSVPLAKIQNDIGDEIVEQAQAKGVKLIVIGTQGRTGLARLFLGSVAERVVRKAHCDVYVTRPVSD